MTLPNPPDRIEQLFGSKKHVRRKYISAASEAMLIPNGKSWTRATTKQELDEASAKLRALLEDAMLTQVEAADMLGIDHRTMRRYVLGQVGYSYCVWFAMLVVHEQKTAEKPNADALR